MHCRDSSSFSDGQDLTFLLLIIGNSRGKIILTTTQKDKSLHGWLALPPGNLAASAVHYRFWRKEELCLKGYIGTDKSRKAVGESKDMIRL